MRILTAFFSFDRLSRILGSPHKKDTRELVEPELLDEITLAVNRISKYTPWRCMCLEQGLTAKILLKRRKLSSTLFFGVQYDHQKKLNAHAWLVCADRIVTGKITYQEFKTIASFT